MSYIYVIYVCTHSSTATLLRLCSVRMGGGAHGILFIRSDALELVQRVIAELRRCEEEARLQDLPTGRFGRTTQGGKWWHTRMRSMAATISYKNDQTLVIFGVNVDKYHIRGACGTWKYEPWCWYINLTWVIFLW